MVAPDGSVIELDARTPYVEEVADEPEDTAEINRELRNAEQTEARDKRAAETAHRVAAVAMESALAERGKAEAAQKQYEAAQAATASLATIYARLKNSSKAAVDAVDGR